MKFLDHKRRRDAAVTACGVTQQLREGVLK